VGRDVAVHVADHDHDHGDDHGDDHDHDDELVDDHLCGARSDVERGTSGSRGPARGFAVGCGHAVGSTHTTRR